MIAAAGLELGALWSVEPGDYARRPPDLDHPEFLVIARRASPSLDRNAEQLLRGAQERAF